MLKYIVLASGQTRYLAGIVADSGKPYIGRSKSYNGYDELGEGYYSWDNCKNMKSRGYPIPLPTIEEEPAAFFYLQAKGANHYMGLYDRRKYLPLIKEHAQKEREEQEKQRILNRTKRYNELKEKTKRSVRFNDYWKDEWKGVVDIVKLISTGTQEELKDFKYIAQRQLEGKYDFYNVSDIEERNNDYEVIMEIAKKKAIQTYETRIAGVGYENRQSIISQMDSNTPIWLERDPTNEHDENAVKVMVKINEEDKHIGFLPRAYAEDVAPLMDNQEHVVIQIKRIRTETYGEDYNGWSSWEQTGVEIILMYEDEVNNW